MSFDEITTKLELEPKKDDKVVHVDFTKKAAAIETKLPPIFEPGRSSLFPSFEDIKLNKSIVIRVVAVLAVVLLSLFLI